MTTPKLLRERAWHKIEVTENAPTARSSHTVTCVDQKICVFGGELEARVPLEPTLYVYDMDANTWSVRLPEERPWYVALKWLSFFLNSQLLAAAVATLLLLSMALFTSTVRRSTRSFLVLSYFI
jgi:hypothetical protein